MTFQYTGNRFLCIGDSITQDTVSPTEGAYRYYLKPLLDAYIGSDIVFVGDDTAVGLGLSGVFNSVTSNNRMCGTSGQRIDEINSTYSPATDMAGWYPDYVLIHIGTNDMTQLNSGAWVGGSVAISIANLSTLLDTIRAGRSDCVVFVCQLIPNQTAGAETNIVAWNAALTTMVNARSDAANIIIVDQHTAFTSNPNWATDYMNDNTHPKSAGKSVMATTFYNSFVSNINVGVRATSYRRIAIGNFSNCLSYTTSTTTTTLGSAETLTSTGAWAVSMWIQFPKRDNTATIEGLCSFKTDQPTSFRFIALRGGNDRFIEFGSNANFNRFFSSATVPSALSLSTPGWHNVTVTYDGVSRTAASSYKLYIDAIPLPVISGAGLGVVANTNILGAQGASNLGTFSIAKLQVWNGGSLMTPSQVRDWVFDGAYPVGPTLTRDYRFGDGSGSTLTDSTGNANGTIGTSPWSTNVPAKARNALTVSRTIATARSVAA